ncbi:DNA primase [Anaerofilum sp. BX8]|uniref:DNA primase n=1 Tax=Anaerofilum hominis TaxID=2763016 RepID=A0A923I8P2_9FIRM|nr:DNA primase [Anaerofilum hominis]MBC5580303.1 DNA primase [Anaerofilum hominis]
MAISPDYLQELSQRTDIAELVGGYVQLRRRGRTYTGLCPFHSEKTPSFVVYPETASFYCFGCGAGGDAITFVKRINNLDYIEAVKFLAARAGMPLPDDRDDTGKIKRRILAMNKDTARFYFEQLNTDEGRAARGYLRGRALSDGTIRRFGLGYSPEGYHATSDHLRKKGYTEEEMLAGGIIKRGQRGGTYDFFHGRVMFPIIDLRGNVIAFGGRRMGDEGGPKYLNSGDTPVFKKSRNMFALNIAKRSQSKRYILCEGYMDAIALHQAGFDTAVAPLGTAFTPEQAKLLSTYADELVLSYDSDEAGQKATRRAIGILANEPVKVSILTVQGAKDPDEFIKKYGAERFQMLLDGCNNAIEYELARARANYDLAKPDGRVGYLRDAIEILSGRVTPTERDVYAGRLAEETDVEKKTVLTQLEARLRAKSRKAAKEREKALLGEGAAAQIKVPYTQGGQKALGVAFAEQQLMAAAIKDPEYLKTIAARLSPGQFITPEMAEVFQLLLQKQQRGEYVDFTQLSGELPEATVSLLSRVLAQNYDVGFTARDVTLYMERIEESVPKSAAAAGMSPQELEGYLERLKQKRK